MIKTAITPLFLTILLSLLGCAEQKDNDTLLAEAEIQIDQGETTTATINLKNILQAEPNHSDARYLLGKLYYNNDNFLAAEKELKLSVNSNPKNTKANLALAKNYLALNQYEEVINTLANKIFDTPTDKIQAKVITAQAYLNLDNIEQAELLIKEVQSIDNNSKYSIFGEALLAAYKNNTDKAINLLSTVISSNEEFLDAILLKGSVHSNAKQYQLAAETYLLYYQKKPRNFAIRTLVAHNFIKAGKYDEAKQHIDALLSINSEHPTVNVLAAQIAYAQQDFELAKNLANKASSTTNSGLAQMISGLSSYQLGEHEQAYYQLNAITDHLPKNHQVNRMLAILQVKLGYTDELSTNLEAFSNDPALFASIGREFANTGDTQSATEMFNSASQLAPDNAQLKALLGILKLAEDDHSGIKELQKAVELAPNFDKANIALAMNYVKQGEYKKAQELAQAWLKKEPESVASLILNGNISNHINDKNAAVSFFERATKVAPTNIIPLFNLAVIAAENRDFSTSNKWLDQLFAIDLEYPYAYRLAIGNAMAEKKGALLEEKLTSFINQTPQAIWPRIILARRLDVKNKQNEALELLTQLTNYSLLPNAYFHILKQILLKDNQFDELFTAYLNWQKAQPNNEEAYLAQMKLLEEQGKYQDALTITQETLALEQFKQNFQFQSLEAYYLLATSQFSLADQKIRRLSAIKPEHSFVLRLQGQLAMAQSAFDKAINYLQRSYKLNPKDEIILYLATSYRNVQEIEKSIHLLKQLSTKHPANLTYQSILAELYMTQEPDKAINIYEKLLSEKPGNLSTLNNLAWLYYEKGELEHAASFSQKAVKLSPNHPEILDTYGIILTKQNKLEEAIKVLSSASKLSPNNKQILSHLALAYKANNQHELAEKTLKSIPTDNITSK